MNQQQEADVRELAAKGYSHLYIAACVDGVDHLEIDDLLGSLPHPKDRMPPKLREWWMQQPWIWRPDNKEPIEAPWERVSREWF